MQGSALGKRRRTEAGAESSGMGDADSHAALKGRREKGAGKLGETWPSSTGGWAGLGDGHSTGAEEDNL